MNEVMTEVKKKRFVRFVKRITCILTVVEPATCYLSIYDGVQRKLDSGSSRY